jgi:hypothetical protein
MIFRNFRVRGASGLAKPSDFVPMLRSLVCVVSGVEPDVSSVYSSVAYFGRGIATSVNSDVHSKSSVSNQSAIFE